MSKIKHHHRRHHHPSSPRTKWLALAAGAVLVIYSALQFQIAQVVWPHLVEELRSVRGSVSSLWESAIWGNHALWGVGALLFSACCLVFENLLLALGALIGAGATLKGLSWHRFHLHSLAPSTVLSMGSLAARAGSSAAARAFPALLWGVALSAAATTAIYAIYLELGPVQDSYGMLRYSLAGRTRGLTTAATLVPVILANAVMLALGWMAWARAPALWPLVAAPVAMFVAAGAASEDAMIYATNLAEVLLFGAMAWAECHLRSSGSVYLGTEAVA